MKVHFRREKRKTQIYNDYNDEGAKANMNKDEDDNMWTENKEDKRKKVRGKMVQRGRKNELKGKR